MQDYHHAGAGHGAPTSARAVSRFERNSDEEHLVGGARTKEYWGGGQCLRPELAALQSIWAAPQKAVRGRRGLLLLAPQTAWPPRWLGPVPPCATAARRRSRSCVSIGESDGGSRHLHCRGRRPLCSAEGHHQRQPAGLRHIKETAFEAVSFLRGPSYKNWSKPFALKLIQISCI